MAAGQAGGPGVQGQPLGDDVGELRLTWHGQPVVRPVPIDVDQARVYARWLVILNETGIPYALGGAYAVYAYTGAWRNSKDLDVFLRPQELKPALEALRAAGYHTEVRDRLWLAKVHRAPFFMDLLFAVRHTTSLRVTEEWFASCRPVELLGVQAPMLGVEEVIATKVYLAARDRFDGADILHLVRASRGQVDWERILTLLHGDEEILLWHLVLYQIVYPGHGGDVPAELVERAFERLKASRHAPHDVARFRGMLLDPESFAVDVAEWGHEDSRAQRPLVAIDGSPL